MNDFRRSPPAAANMPTSHAPPPQPGLIFADSARQPDLLYLTGLFSEDPFLWFSVNGQQFLAIAAMELGRARRTLPETIEVLSFKQAREAWNMEDKPAAPAAYIVAAARHFSVAKWHVPADFPLSLSLALQAQEIAVEPVEVFCPQRKIKTAVEIEQIESGVRLAEQGLQCGLDILRQSRIDSHDWLRWHDRPLTAELLRGEINAEIVRHGGLVSRTIVAPGRQSADPHETGSGPIPARQPLVLDIFPRIEASGYHGDLTRTVVRGHAEDTVSQAFAAVAAAQEVAIAMIKPGVDPSVVHRRAADILEDHGFASGEKEGVPYGFFHGLGHGLGLELHEQPRLSHSNQKPLEQGDVITVEPGLYYPEWGGVRLEDVVVVTDGGNRNLTAAPIILEIV